MNSEFYNWTKSLTNEEKVIIIREMYNKLVKNYTEIPTVNIISASGLLMIWYYTYQRRFERDIYRALAVMTLHNLGICFNITNFNLYVSDFMEIYEPIFSINEWNQIISDLDKNIYDDLRYNEKIFKSEFNDIKVRLNTLRMENMFNQSDDIAIRLQYFDDNGFNFMSYYNELYGGDKTKQVSNNENYSAPQKPQSLYDEYYDNSNYEIEDEYFSWSDYYGEEPDSNGDYSNESYD